MKPRRRAIVALHVASDAMSEMCAATSPGQAGAHCADCRHHRADEECPVSEWWDVLEVMLGEFEERQAKDMVEEEDEEEEGAEDVP